MVRSRENPRQYVCKTIRAGRTFQIWNNQGCAGRDSIMKGGNVMHSEGDRKQPTPTCRVGTWRVPYAWCAATKPEPRATDISPSISPAPAKNLLFATKNRMPTPTPISSRRVHVHASARFSRAGKGNVCARSRAERGGDTLVPGRVCARRKGAGGKSGKEMVQVTNSKSGVQVENGK